MRNFIDFLKVLSLCGIVTILGIGTYSFVNKEIENRARVYLGERKTLIEAMNYRKQRCDVQDVDSVSVNSVTLRYKCGSSTIYITQKAVDIQVLLPKGAKIPTAYTNELQ